MKTTLFAVIVSGLFILSSCTEETQIFNGAQEAKVESPSFLVDEEENGYTGILPTEHDEALLDHAKEASEDYFNAERVTVERPDGSQDVRYLVGGDIELSKEELNTLRGMDDALLKQYRTFNTVGITNISVIGYTGSGFALTSKMRTALRWAVNNYNALNINKNFSLSFSASTNADIVVYRNVNNNGAGGVAGFPSGGRPYKWVQIYNGMENYNTNTNEHVITHEIGHCMGLRHTDYATRASCNQSGEAAGSDGAVYIPGTPSGFDPNSVMLACFSSNEDGEFGFYDRVALEYMY